MRRISALVLLVLLAFSNAQSQNRWNDLIPRGKEVDYNYEAILNAGISVPDDHSSRFHLRGLLHIQAGDQNELLLRLSDVNFTLDNGRVSEFPHKVPMQLGNHMSALTTPIRLVQDKEGNFEEIGLEESTPEHIRNIQKALASLLQLDWSNINLNSKKLHSFKSLSPSITGFGEHIYNVIPKGNLVRIEKMEKTQSTSNDYREILNTLNTQQCDERFEEPLSRDSQKVYTIDRSQNRLRRIENNGGIYYHPFQTVPPAYHIHVKQILELISEHDIEKTMVIKKETRVDSLSMVHGDVNDGEELVSNREALVPKAQKFIEEILQFTENRKIEMSQPDFEKLILPSRLRRLLKHLDVDLLEKLLKSLKEKEPKVVDLLHQMLPFVGTRDSNKFLISLIKDKRMNDHQAITALYSVPFHINVNENILRDSEVLLDLGGSSEVQNIANLCFGSLLKRARDNQSAYVPHRITERYVRIINKKIKDSKRIDEKHSLMNALFNADSLESNEALKEMLEDKQLRMKALLSIRSSPRDSQTAKEVSWQILMDRTLPSDMRIRAFHTLMKSRPSLSTLINVIWKLHSERDVDLYQFCYTFLESLANIKNPCEKSMRLKATQLMKYMPRPSRHSLTEFRTVDRFDTKINRGQNIDWYLVDTKDSLMVHVKFGETIMNLKTNPFSFFMRISGLKGKLLDNVKMNIQKGMRLFNFDDVVQTVMNCLQDDNVVIDFGFTKNDQIVLADTIQKATSAAKTKFYMECIRSLLQNNLQVDFDRVYSMDLPSDIGFVFRQTVQKVQLGRLPMQIKLEGGNIQTLNLNGKMDTSELYINALFAHNPITQSWQSVGKAAVEDTVSAINVDINLNIQQRLLKISMKEQKAEEDNISTKRNYVGHFVYNLDYTNSGNLKKFNPNTQDLVIVPTNPKLRNKHTIVENDDPNTGCTTTVTVFDTEDSKSVDQVSELQLLGLDTVSRLERSIKRLQFNNDLVSHILRHSMMDHNLAMMYRNRVRGVLIQQKPSKQHQITNIDLSLRLDHEITSSSPSQINPGMKVMLKGNFALKKQEELVKRWDVNVNWELNNGHTQNIVKGQLTRTKAGETDFKICIEGGETYSDTGLTGNLNIKMGSSSDGTCKEESNIEIHMKGERLPEQQKGMNNFPSCQRKVIFGIENMPSDSCLRDITSIRKYDIEITSKNLPQRLQRSIQSFVEFTKSKYQNHYSVEPSNESQKGGTKVSLSFPVSNDVLDMVVTRDGRNHKLTALPAVNFRRLGIFTPDNLHYSNVRRFMHNTGLMHTCSANQHDINNVNNDLVPNAIQDDWVLAFGNKAENPDKAIWIKRIDNKLAIKLVNKVHILLVSPKGNSFSLTIDGQTVSNERLLTNDWLTLQTEGNILAVLTKESGTQIVYNRDEVVIELPKLNLPMAGRCL